jgi:hypothetical protein
MLLWVYGLVCFSNASQGKPVFNAGFRLGIAMVSGYLILNFGDIFGKNVMQTFELLFLEKRIMHPAINGGRSNVTELGGHGANCQNQEAKIGM